MVVRSREGSVGQVKRLIRGRLRAKGRRRGRNAKEQRQKVLHSSVTKLLLSEVLFARFLNVSGRACGRAKSSPNPGWTEASSRSS